VKGRKGSAFLVLMNICTHYGRILQQTDTNRMDAILMYSAHYP